MRSKLPDSDLKCVLHFLYHSAHDTRALAKDNKEAAEKFKEATGAYEVLSDDGKRQLYDTYGHQGVDPNFAGGGGGGNPFAGFEGFQGFGGGDGSFHFSSSGNSQEIDPEELFNAFFGGGTRNRGPQPGADIQTNVRLSFREAIQGVEKDLHLRYQVRGKPANQQYARAEVKERDVKVDIPAGIDDGMTLRLAGQGAEGDPGAPRGDLHVRVSVADDGYFTRDGADVHTECPFSFTQAVLGGTVDVRTLNGVVEMKIPRGTQVGARLMLRGKGIPRLRASGRGAGKGDHIVHLKMEIPKGVSKRQEELLREFDAEMQDAHGGIYGRLSEAAESVFKKVFGHDDAKGEKNNEKGGASDDDEGGKKQRAA